MANPKRDQSIDTYTKLKAVANGDTSMYQAYQNANNAYQNSLGENLSNKNSYELGTYNAYKDAYQANSELANSMYNKYLDNQSNAVKSKNSQYTAQQNAMKYAQNALNMQGLGTQGISETTRNNIYNTYAGNIAQIDQNTNNANNDLYNAYMRTSNDNLSKARSTELENLALQRADEDSAIYTRYTNTLEDNALTNTNEDEAQILKEAEERFGKNSKEYINLERQVKLNQEARQQEIDNTNYIISAYGIDLNASLDLHTNNTNEKARNNLNNFISQNKNIANGTIFRLDKNTVGGNDYYYVYIDGKLYNVDRGIALKYADKDYYYVKSKGIEASGKYKK